MKYTIGIDEAGRGPLAGPVSVGVFAIEKNQSEYVFSRLIGLRDSKKLSEKKREELFQKIRELSKQGKCFYSVSLTSSSIIDRHGIVFAIKKSLNKCLNDLREFSIAPDNSELFLDGGLSAPNEYTRQSTIIKGDDLIPLISAASICAKVMRDKKMVSLSKKFPKYCFDIHKGYGTKLHCEKIKKYGPCQIHRRTFIS